MKSPKIIVLVLICTQMLIACSQEQAATEVAAPVVDATAARNELDARAGAPLFDGMGNHHHSVTTSDSDAQRYFDQGIVIDFAFNHAESARSFRAAQTLDPECAMCYWGEALALGPNINVTSENITARVRLDIIGFLLLTHRGVVTLSQGTVP